MDQSVPRQSFGKSESILSDAQWRRKTFARALNAIYRADIDYAKQELRAVINGQLGFERLADLTCLPSKSLHRMLSEKGNPTAKNLGSILQAIIAFEGYEAKVIVNHSRAWHKTQGAME
jgi:DNA-binding phage protein